MHSFLDGSVDEISKATTIFYRIRLRLNPEEHTALLANLEKAISVLSGEVPFTDREAVDLVVEAVASESQTVLKKEWRRVKRGEVPFFVTKHLSLVALALTSVLLIFYLTGKISITWVTY